MFLPWQFDNDTLFFLLLAVLRVSKIQTIFSDQLEFQKLLFSWNKKASKKILQIFSNMILGLGLYRRPRLFQRLRDRSWKRCAK